MKGARILGRSVRHAMPFLLPVLLLLPPVGTAQASAKDKRVTVELRARSASSVGGYRFGIVTQPTEKLYRLQMYFLTPGKNDNHLAVTFLAPSPRPASRAMVSRRRIRAQLGDLGSMDMRFHRRAGGRRRHRFGCYSRTVSRGELRGHLRFTAPNGSLRLRRRTLDASLIREVERPSCSSPPGLAARGKDPVDAVLEACRENGSYFAGYGYFDFLRPEFEATSPLVHAHGLIQAGYVHERGFVRQFRAEPDLSFASVSPPAPFSGSATFTDGRLEGDLAVEFPGTRSFRLTPADATLTDDLSESCLWGWDGARAAGAGDSSPGLRAALEQLGRLARRG